MKYTIFYTLFSLYIPTIFAHQLPTYNWENNANNTKFIDLSPECKNDSVHDIFIPMGVGTADAVVILISQPSHETLPRCKINFHIAQEHRNHLQILVIEVMENLHNFHEIIADCYGKHGRSSLIFYEDEPKTEPVDVCDSFEEFDSHLPIFARVSFAKTVRLKINASEVFHSMKITATAGRNLGRHEYCNATYEIQCTIERQTICINRALSCDRNINCGIYDQNDEDYKVCRVTRFAYLWIVVLAGLVTLVLVFVIFVYLLKTYIAGITDNFFIFNEDEDNKLVIRSQLKSHVWQKFRRDHEKYPPCLCQTMSDTSYDMTLTTD